MVPKFWVVSDSRRLFPGTHGPSCSCQWWLSVPAHAHAHAPFQKGDSKKEGKNGKKSWSLEFSTEGEEEEDEVRPKKGQPALLEGLDHHLKE